MSWKTVHIITKCKILRMHKDDEREIAGENVGCGCVVWKVHYLNYVWFIFMQLHLSLAGTECTFKMCFTNMEIITCCDREKTPHTNWHGNVIRNNDEYWIASFEFMNKTAQHWSNHNVNQLLNYKIAHILSLNVVSWTGDTLLRM